MSILSLLNDLRREGARFWLEGEQLRYSAPQGVLTQERLANLKSGRAEFVELLHAAQGETRVPIVAQERGHPLEVSYYQERLWLIQARDGTEAYTATGGLRFEGDLSVEALETALNSLVARHEPLRTRFSVLPGEDAPTQRIDPPRQLALALRDVADTAAVALVMGEQAAEPLDIESGWPVRFQLIRLAQRQHVLLISLHLIAADGWSFGVLGRDLMALYAAERTGEAATLPDLSIQYADYAYWQRRQDLGRSLAYWTESLSGYREPLDLTVSGRGADSGHGLAQQMRRALPPALAARLGTFAKARRASLFMVLLTGVALLAHRQTRRTDLCIGTTVAGRDDVALEPLIGFFVNILPLRIDLSGDPTGSALFEQVKALSVAGLSHKAVPFEHMLSARPEGRHEGSRSLVPVVMRHQNYPETDVTGAWAGDLEVHSLDVDLPRPATSDLDLQYFGDAHDLRVVAEFDGDRLDEAHVTMLLTLMEELLDRFATQPDARLSELVALREVERSSLRQWNDTGVVFERASLCALFAERVRATPDAPACLSEDGSVSFAELDRRSDALARVLMRRGAVPGMPVAVCQARGPALLAAALAVFKAGCVFVPVDPSYPEAYISRLLNDVEPAITLVEPELETSLGRFSAEALWLDADVFSGDEGPLAPVVPGPDAIAYIAYTSGSTGRPKGVMVEHRQVLNCLQALWLLMPFGADEMVAQKTSPAFVPYIKEMLASLLAGVPQVVLPDLLVRDTPAFAEALKRHRVTRLYLVPSHLEALLDHADQIGALRDVVTAGEALPQALRRRFEAALPEVRLHNNYGCTELHDIAYCSPGDQEAEGHTVPIGRPIANTSLHVLDEAMQPLPPGVPGMLYVEGASVGPGYWRQPELSAERFLPGLSGRPDVRMFGTGDMARWLPDGRLDYLGRRDFQVKVRGQSVEVTQVEFELEQHDGIGRAAIALGTGQLNGVLIAYVVPAVAGTPVDGTALHAWLRQRLPGHMVPSRFVRCAALPHLPNGKLDRSGLKAISVDAALAGSDHGAPKSPLERKVAVIWAELLEIPADQIARNDNFFALGGHSLMAARVVARIRQQLGLAVPFRTVFDASTLHDLAVQLEQLDPTAENDDIGLVIERKLQGTNAPLSRGQQLVWHSQAFEDTGRQSDAWNLSWAACVKGPLDVGILQTAFQILLERHDVLSHEVSAANDGFEQRKLPSPPSFAVTVVDAQAEGLGDARSIERVLRDHRQQGFDCRTEPLIRCLLIECEPERFALQFTVHHMAGDAWSLGIIAAEVGTLYVALMNGMGNPLPPLPFQFTDYVFWERRAELAVIERQRAYWLERLSDAPKMTGLPLDRPRRNAPLGRTNRVVGRFTPVLGGAIKAMAQDQQSTPFAILLGALHLLVRSYTGQDDQVVVLPVALREHPDFEQLVGVFVNALPIRNRIDASTSFLELIAEVQRTMLAAHENCHMPFNRLVSELGSEHRAGVPPLSQVLFGVVNAPGMEASLPGMEMSPLPLDGRTAWFDTRINIFERSGMFVVEWDYVMDLFDHATVEGFVGRYIGLLEAAMAHADAPMATLTAGTALEQIVPQRTTGEVLQWLLRQDQAA